MRLEFESFINKHEDKTAIVLGLGPSAGVDINRIKYLQEQGTHIVICCNDYDLMVDITADYWMHANSVDTLGKNFGRYNAKKSTIVYADSVDVTNQSFVDSYINCDYASYDQRHFKGKPCLPQAVCCLNIIPRRLTIQEELRDYCNMDIHYGTGDTIALHMLSLAVLMGCKNIFVTGVDLDYSRGYVNGGRIPADRMNDLAPHMKRIVSDFNLIATSASNINTNIFLTNRNSPLANIFDVKSL